MRQRERALGCGRAVVDDGRGRGHPTVIVIVIVGVRGAEDGDLRLLLADHVEEAVLCEKVSRSVCC